MKNFFALNGQILYWTLIAPFRGQPFNFGEVFHQMVLIGVRALPMAALTSFSIGLTMAMQGAGALRKMGGLSFVPDLVTLSLLRELGPLIVAVIVIGRSASAVTAELGKFLPAEKPELLGLAFVRFDELMRVDYELFRAGKMIGSQTLLGRILDDVLMNREQPGPRPTKLSGAKLPPFVAIRKYLPPVGLLVRQTADGIQVIALTYEKAAPAEAK